MGIINPTSFTSVSIQSAQRTIIPLLTTAPDLVTQLDPARTPGELVGFYNSSTDRVELFVVTAGGTFWTEVG